MEAAAGARVLLELSGVSIHPRLQPGTPRGEGVEGRLRLLQGPDDLLLQWEPLEGSGDHPDDLSPHPEEDDDPPDPGYEPDWAVLAPPRLRPQPHPGWGGGFVLPLGGLRGLRRGPPGLRRPLLVLLPQRGPCPPPLHCPRGEVRQLLQLLGPRLRPCPWDPRVLLVTTPDDPDPPPEAPSPGIVTRLLQGPCAAVGGLGRLLGGPRGSTPSTEEGAPELEPPFEVISCVTLGPRPSPARGPPVTSEEWERSLDPEGLRERLFRGGLSPEVRPQGWRWLLGLGGNDDPQKEKERSASYQRMKMQWVSLSPGQWCRNSPLRSYRRRLERDLVRCHPDVPPSERQLLQNILLTFCMFHFDLGYVGGMSEVLAPLLTVAPGEAEAFWAFCSIMELVGSNFGPSKEGLQRQLGQLGQLLRVLDPPLCQRLDSRDPSRWLQLRFLPHLGLEGTLRLWEVLWTRLPCPNFLLLVCCILLESLGEREGEGETPPSPRESDSDSDWDEPCPSSCRPPVIDAQELLSRAEGLFLQLAAAPDLPPALQELLGLGLPPSPLPEGTGDLPKSAP